MTERAHQRPQLRFRRRRIVERMREGVVAIGVEREEAPVQRRLDRIVLALSTMNAARHGEDRRCIKEEPAGRVLHAQIDAALCLGRGPTLCRECRCAASF
jgi:hypothetical protein